jgi:hypothetical protein
MTEMDSMQLKEIEMVLGITIGLIRLIMVLCLCAFKSFCQLDTNIKVFMTEMILSQERRERENIK